MSCILYAITNQVLNAVKQSPATLSVLSAAWGLVQYAPIYYAGKYITHNM